MRIYYFLILMCISYLSNAQAYLWGDTLQFPDDRSITAMVADSQHNLYVASVSYQPGDWIFAQYYCGNIHLRKYNQTGGILWEKIFAGKGHVFDLRLDNAGDLVAAGAFLDNINIGGEDFTTPHAWVAAAFLFKTDTTGNVQWAFSETPAQNTIFWNIGIDNANNITVTGLKDDITALLKQYDIDGNFVWEKDLSNIRTSSGIEFDSDGNIFVSGTIDSYASFDGFDLPLPVPLTGYANYLAKIDAVSLNTLNVWAVNYATFDFNAPLLRKDNKIYWHCNLQESGGFFLNDFILKIDPETEIADTIRNEPSDVFGFPLNYLSAGENEIYITGNNFSDAFIVRMDEEGNLLDSLVLPGLKYGFEKIASVDSNLWIGGYISLDSLVLDTITLYTETDDYIQPFVAQYGFAVVPEDTIPDTVVTTLEIIDESELIIYPNPLKTETFFISHTKAIDYVSISDIAGREIPFAMHEINPTTLKIKMELIADGFYFIELIVDDQKMVCKILKK